MLNFKIKNYLKIMIVAVFVSSILFSFLPISANASLVPCATSENSRMCTLCDLIVGIHGVMSFGFKIMVVVAIVMIMVAGIVYIVSAGSTSMMDMAKHLLTNALVGFAIILGAWLIINTVMTILGTKGDLGVQATNWYTFECEPNNK